MSRYLDRLRDLPNGAKNLERATRLTDKTDKTPEKDTSVSFVSTPSGPSQNFTSPPPLSATDHEAIAEARAERRAVLELDGQLAPAAADRVAELAARYYSHLMGEAKATNCCFAPAGRLCPEGRRRRDAYVTAAELAERNRPRRLAP